MHTLATSVSSCTTFVNVVTLHVVHMKTAKKSINLWQAIFARAEPPSAKYTERLVYIGEEQNRKVPKSKFTT